jgi:hypothetical protein
MEHVWKRVPEDHEVSALFQTTGLRAGLSSGLSCRSSATTWQGARGQSPEGRRVGGRIDDAELQIIVRSASLVDALNQRIESIDPRLPRLTTGEGVATYRLRQSPYEALADALGAPSQARAATPPLAMP